MQYIEQGPYRSSDLLLLLTLILPGKKLAELLEMDFGKGFLKIVPECDRCLRIIYSGSGMYLK